MISLITAGAASASGAARAIGHIVAVCLLGVMMIVLIAYTAYATNTRRTHIEPHWYRDGPLYLACLAAFFIILDPIRHVVMDHTGGIIAGQDLGWLLREYKCGDETFRCFALGGW